MDERISLSVLSEAAGAIADTNRGLPGKKIISYCNKFAVKFDIVLPFAVYPYGAVSKREVLLANLKAFQPSTQYQLLLTLCGDFQFFKNEDVKAIRKILTERYSHLGEEDGEHQNVQDQPATASFEAEEKTIPEVSAPFKAVVPHKPYNIFLSYSHKDEELVTFVREHLMLFDRQDKIRKWWDRKLLAGDYVNVKIKDTLASADIILLFVSSSFIASDYCFDVEMKQALQQHEDGRSVVVPVILRSCSWHGAPFGHLVALPTDGVALTRWDDRDEGAKNIADGVMRLVAELQKKS